MKMKYLVLGASCLIFGVGVLYGATTAPAGAVVGWWKFDNPDSSGLDSSEYGNHLTTLRNARCVTKDTGYTNRGYYNDSGCLEITGAGGYYSGTAQNVWDTSSGYTYLARIRTQMSVSSAGDTQGVNLCNMLNDNAMWHVVSYRYDPRNVTGSGSFKYGVFGDDPMAVTDNRSSADSNSSSTFIITPDIKVGGSISFKYKILWEQTKTIDFKGYIDDAVSVARTMSKSEIQTYMKTGEFNPFLRSDNDVSFNAATGWSCNDTEKAALGYGPHNLPGADFQVYGGTTIKATSAHAGTTFGGHSLSIGRIAPLVDLSTGAQVSSVVGNFVQQASVTIPDLRLNSGKITASAGTVLMATKLAVNATSENPFEVAVASGTYTITGTSSGSGVLSKTGSGKLDLGGLSGTAKLRLAEGSIKTPRLDGYTGGTVIVDGDAVTFTGTDTLSGTIQVRYDGTIAAAEATYPVLNAPTLTSASQVAITAAIPEKYEGAPKLENGVVSLVVTKKVALIPDEDKGAKPVLLWQ